MFPKITRNYYFVFNQIKGLPINPLPPNLDTDNGDSTIDNTNLKKEELLEKEEEKINLDFCNPKTRDTIPDLSKSDSVPSNSDPKTENSNPKASDSDPKTEITNPKASNYDPKVEASPNISGYVPFTLSLEVPIVSHLKLQKLGIFDEKYVRDKNLLNGLKARLLSSRSAAVRGGFVFFWKAEFIIESGASSTDFKTSYTIQFVSSTAYMEDKVEEHLASLPKFKVTANSPSYIYKSNTLKKVGGRRY